MALKKLIQHHHKKHILVPALSHIKQPTGQIEPQHPTFSLKGVAWHQKVHLEAEIRIRQSVRKEGQESQAVAHGDMVVNHR